MPKVGKTNYPYTAAGKKAAAAARKTKRKGAGSTRNTTTLKTSKAKVRSQF